MQNCNAGNHTGRLTADSTAAPTNRPGNNTLVPHPADYAAARRRRGRPGPGPGAARMPHIALDINPSCPTGAGPVSFCGPVHPLARPRHAARLAWVPHGAPGCKTPNARRHPRAACGARAARANPQRQRAAQCVRPHWQRSRFVARRLGNVGRNHSVTLQCVHVQVCQESRGPRARARTEAARGRCPAPRLHSPARRISARVQPEALIS